MPAPSSNNARILSPDERKDEDDYEKRKALAEKEVSLSCLGSGPLPIYFNCVHQDRLRALMAQADQMRAELERERLGIKREPSPIRLPPKIINDIIDLTDD